jgi:hypothetical protein
LSYYLATPRGNFSFYAELCPSTTFDEEKATSKLERFRKVAKKIGMDVMMKINPIRAAPLKFFLRMVFEEKN